jgi:hypothetical protein
MLRPLLFWSISMKQDPKLTLDTSFTAPTVPANAPPDEIRVAAVQEELQVGVKTPKLERCGFTRLCTNICTPSQSLRS